MTNDEKIESYAKENPLLYADVLECVKKGSARVEYAEADGILLAEKDSDIYMFACKSEGAGLRILANLPRERLVEKSALIVSHGAISDACIKTVYPVQSETPCYQAVYEKETIAPVGNLTYAFPTDEQLARIIEVYDRESPENLRLLHIRKQIICAHNEQGEWVGFIGRHPEGSMGLLLIFPEQRNKGYAFALETYLIQTILKEGRLPYAHIVEDNVASLHLQRKLGFSVASEKVVWNRIAK